MCTRNAPENTMTTVDAGVQQLNIGMTEKITSSVIVHALVLRTSGFGVNGAGGGILTVGK